MYSVSTETQGMVATKSFSKEANYQVSIMNEQKVIRKAVSDLGSEIERYQLMSDELEIMSSCSEVEEDVREAECSCCGLKEECTKPYIEEVEKSFSGKWVCGLCSEAVKEKLSKFPNTAIEEAVSSHREFCSSTRLNPKLWLTTSMREIAKRNYEKRNSNHLGMTSKLSRSISCDPRVLKN